MCLYTNASGLCNHPECIISQIWQPVPCVSNRDLLIGMNSILLQHSSVLKDLLAKVTLLDNSLTLTQQFISKKPKRNLSKLTENHNTEKIIEWITSGTDCTMFLKLSSSIPKSLYKEKGFKIDAVVTDSSGLVVALNSTIIFTIDIYTVENPPKLLKTNISGKKILRGTVEAEADEIGNIHFDNVVVNEVTSHYPNDSFCFIVYSAAATWIKPLTISGVCVKARKHAR